MTELFIKYWPTNENIFICRKINRKKMIIHYLLNHKDYLANIKKTDSLTTGVKRPYAYKWRHTYFTYSMPRFYIMNKNLLLFRCKAEFSCLWSMNAFSALRYVLWILILVGQKMLRTVELSYNDHGYDELKAIAYKYRLSRRNRYNCTDVYTKKVTQKA